MEVKVTWDGRMHFTGSGYTGFTVPLDASPDVGGDNNGFRPLELFAIGVAGCTAMDVISILQKKRQKVTAYEVQLHIDQPDTVPYVFLHVTVEYFITGENVYPKAVERAIHLSATKYCPATAMLEKSVEIDHTYNIIEEVVERTP